MDKVVPVFSRRKPERHLRQMQSPRLEPGRTTAALRAKEVRTLQRQRTERR